MNNIEVKSIGKTEWIVEEKHLASLVGSGDQNVFSTPSLVALMENSAMNVINKYLEKGETSVGVEINVKHLASTPLGMKVSSTAEITEVDGRKVTFFIEAFDEKEKIGEACHTRFILNAEKFILKANSKL